MKKRTKTKTKTQLVVIRNYRDTLFRMLYRNKKRVFAKEQGGGVSYVLV